MVKGKAPRGRWPRQAGEWGDWGSDPALPPRRHVGARPATLLQGWTPATCTLRRGRQGGGHLSAPPFESRGPRGSVSGLQMARGPQGDAGAGLGRQVQPEGARSPLTASWPTGPNESACSPEGPQLRFWKLPAPWPLTPMEPWSGISGSSQTIGAPEPQRQPCELGRAGQQCPSVATVASAAAGCLPRSSLRVDAGQRTPSVPGRPMWRLVV